MKYIVIEIQEAADGTVGNIVTAHDTLKEAESKFHTVLSYAAVSDLPAHSAVLLDSHANAVDARCYMGGGVDDDA